MLRFLRAANRPRVVAVAAPSQALLRTLFVKVEDTPNPDSMKFVPDEAVLKEDQPSSMQFSHIDEAMGSPLVQSVMEIPSVTGVYLTREFIAVNKEPEVQWRHLQEPIVRRIMDAYASGGPLVRVLASAASASQADGPDEDDDEIVAMIKELLEVRIRPSVQADGGDILFVRFDEATGIVHLKMMGSCVGCPSSSQTLHGGVERMLMYYVEEVTGVVAVDDDAGAQGKEAAAVEAAEPAETLEERLAAAGVPGANPGRQDA